MHNETWDMRTLRATAIAITKEEGSEILVEIHLMGTQPLK